MFSAGTEPSHRSDPSLGVGSTSNSSSASSSRTCGASVVRRGAPSGPFDCVSSATRATDSGGGEGAGFVCFSLPFFFFFLVATEDALAAVPGSGLLLMLTEDLERATTHAPVLAWYAVGCGVIQRSREGTFAVITGYWDGFSHG